MNISVIGLGKLGAPWAAVLASKGHRVIGVDLNPAHVDAVNRATAPISEPGLPELICASKASLSATTSIEEAVWQTDTTFIVLPTPSAQDGSFSLASVLAAIRAVGAALRHKDEFHLVVITSTVMPGDCDAQIRPALEEAAGKRVGPALGLCYNPEFIALGSVIHDMLHPDFILIGESDTHAGDALISIHRSVCGDDVRIARMNFVNAELTKLSVNAFVTTKITFANMLARVCEKLPAADAEVVSGALGLDSRIGKKYLKGAVSYGGPCFPRDNSAFASLGTRLGVSTLLPQATDQMNYLQVSALAQLVKAHLPPHGTVGILGLSYKPHTNVCERSTGIELAAALLAQNVNVTAFDPAAVPQARQILQDRITYAPDMEACARAADVLVITVAWPEFRELRPQWLHRAGTRPTIIDCWRLLHRADFAATANVIVLGVGPSAQSPSLST